MFRKILVLGAHPDDGEFGCGGTMTRYIEEGMDVFYAIFSLCEDSVPKGFHKEILAEEAKESAKILGLRPQNLFIYRFKVRTFPKYRQEILEELVTLRNRLKPDLIFLPSDNDLHQDHQTLANEGLRAFKNTSIFAYEVAWNNLVFNTEAFIFLKKPHIEKKIKALKCYKSQKFRSYSKESFVKSLAEVRGTQINTGYAEAFEVVRYILK